MNYNSHSTVQNSRTLQGEEEEKEEKEEGEGEQEATQAREEMLVWVVDLKLVAASVEDSALMLFLSVLKKEENENGGVDGLLKLLPLWRKREKQSVEREKCGGEDGDQVGGDSGGGQRCWWLGCCGAGRSLQRCHCSLLWDITISKGGVGVHGGV
jgi:hypothetical protein